MRKNRVRHGTEGLMRSGAWHLGKDVAKAGMLLATVLVMLLSLVLIGKGSPTAKAADDGWRPDMTPMHMESRADGNIYGVCYVRARPEEQQSGTGHNAIKFDIYMPDGKWVQGYCGNGYQGNADHGRHAQPGSDYYNFVAYKWHPERPYGQTDYWIHILSEESRYVNHWGNPTPYNNETAPLFSTSRQWVFGEIWEPKLLDIVLHKKGNPTPANPAVLAGATYTVRKNDNAGFDGQGTSVGAYIKVGIDGIGHLYRWDDVTGATDERLWIAAGVNYVVFEVTPPTNGQYGKDEQKYTVDGQTDGTTLLTREITSTDNEIIEPSIGTTLKAGNGEKTYSTTATSVTLTDTVSYNKLTPDTKYVLQAKLHYRNGAADGGDTADGGETGVTQSKVFTSSSTGTGTVDVSFTVGASVLSAAKPLVCYEYLYHVDDNEQPTGDVVCKHEDITDTEQTVTPVTPKPSIGTTFKTADGGKTVQRGTPSVTLTDTVTYTNLNTTKTYRLQCEIHGRTGNEDKGVIARAIVSHSFQPTAASGSVDVPVPMNLSNIAADIESLVAFEELYDGNTKIAEHKVITDAGQTVTLDQNPPEDSSVRIRTTLKTKDGKDTIVLGSASEYELVDTVSYAGLVPGQQYRLVGTLHVKQDDADGGVIGEQGTVTFTPDADSGTVEMPFTVDASQLTGSAVVAFEKIYLNDDEVAAHEDISDESQTVFTTVITIGTKLTTADGKKELTPSSGQTITLHDTVTYKGLTPGQEYELRGEIRLKDGSETGRVVEGSANTLKFTPETADGSVVIDLTISASDVQSWKLVAFEKLYLNEDLVATHEDINDEDQSITPSTPSIETKLMTADGKKEITVTPGQTITLIDEVSYHGLTPGVEYEVKGVLHERKGQSDGGEVKGTEGSIKFTPKAADGTVQVKMTYKVGLEKKILVAFEKLYVKNDEITSHEDINDSAQSVVVNVTNLNKDLIQTGGSVIAAVAVALAAGGAFLMVASRKHRRF